MSETVPREPGSKPNVYFVDDSATMREVVKIAFRREDLNVVTCSDVSSAIALFDQTPPDTVISDVIMPDKDGYSLCEFVKQHPRFGATPVFLMSGVVNQEVAERAEQVKADELIRKPFHPQDLVARVKRILNRAETPEAPAPATAKPANPFGRIFEGSAAAIFSPPKIAAPQFPQTQHPESAPAADPARRPSGDAQELQRLRIEVKRLELLVKKLQTELASEREYSAAIESQLQGLNTSR